MSKYERLWEYIGSSEDSSLLLSFDGIEGIAGVPVDHSFLSYKKELTAFGWRVKKISVKEHTVLFEMTQN